MTDEGAAEDGVDSVEHMPVSDRFPRFKALCCPGRLLVRIHVPCLVQHSRGLQRNCQLSLRGKEPIVFS